jgi:hypothetical protein
VPCPCGPAQAEDQDQGEREVDQAEQQAFGDGEARHVGQRPEEHDHRDARLPANRSSRARNAQPASTAATAVAMTGTGSSAVRAEEPKLSGTVMSNPNA